MVTQYLGVSLAILAILALWVAAIFCLFWAYDEYQPLAYIPGVLLLVIALSISLWAIERASSQPCAEYDTRIMYNAATKSPQLMRYCALPGEWVTP